MSATPATVPGRHIPVDALAFAHGGPVATGCIRREPEDFRVEEILGFEPEGAGDHAWLRITKRGANTDWVAGRLARAAGVSRSAVGYAGLKDRHALTTQWFSVDLSGRDEPTWSMLDDGEITIERVTRGRRKLKRGALNGNRFAIVTRDLAGAPEQIESIVERIRADGVPGYFGAQRFGRDEGNVQAAWRMLVEGRRVRQRHQRSLLLSTARAVLFNRVLDSRVRGGSWNRCLAGEVVMLDGSHSIFAADANDPALSGRVARGDVHPTGPMWGAGDRLVGCDALAAEEGALQGCEDWQRALEGAGLRAARRALRVPVAGLEWSCLDGDRLELRFDLPAGAYATSVLREVVSTRGAKEPPG